MSQDQDKPVDQPKPHLGILARQLREGAGLTRRVFGEQVKLSETQIKSFESGRLKLGTEALQRIFRHPSTKDLHRRAQEAGLTPESSDKGVKGS